MENIAPIAATLTQAFIIHEVGDDSPRSLTVNEVIEAVNAEEWDTQP